MSLRTLFQYMADERKNEAPLFQELRQKYPDFGENLLLRVKTSTDRQSTDDWLNGFLIANTWPELVEFYTGHSSSMIMKKFLSKMLIDKETAEYEYGIDKILSEAALFTSETFASSSTSVSFKNTPFTVKLDKKKTKKMIDLYLLEKMVIAKKVGLNLGQMVNVIDQHKPFPQNFERPRWSGDRRLELFYFLGTEKTYRMLLTWNGEQAGYLGDCVYIYGQLEGYSLSMGYDLSRVKNISVANITTIHDGLVEEQKYIEKKIDSAEIQYKGFRTWLSKIKIEGFDVHLPQTTGELVEIGEQLNNCIGTYKKRVLSGTDTIVAFKDQTTGKFEMGLNVDIQEPVFELTEEEIKNLSDGKVQKVYQNITPGRARIAEFRLNHNRPVQDETHKTVEKQLLELFTEYKKELLDNKTTS